MHDVSYVIATGLSVAQRRAKEREFLAYYRDRLRRPNCVERRNSMLAASAIIAEAEARTGITDSDRGAAGNPERLLSYIRETFPVSADGETRIRSNLLMDATNRLESQKWGRDYPAIADEPIEAPVFLTGLPRSGTTYFQYLFDRDARFRLIRTWE
jgi:hypothetical protein